jgi:hypothetical protein
VLHNEAAGCSERRPSSGPSALSSRWPALAFRSSDYRT